jgi:hypothetical protein
VTSTPEPAPNPYDDFLTWLLERIAKDEHRATYTRDNDDARGPTDSITMTSWGAGYDQAWRP